MILPTGCKSTFRTPNSNFPSVMLLNARSVFNKLNELSSLVYTMKPSIVAVTETWLRPCIPNDVLQLNGYFLHRMDRLGRIGGGVCVWIRNNFPSHLVHASCTAPTTAEILFTKVPCLKLLICVAYIPPNLPSTEKLCITDFLENAMDEQLSQCPELQQIVTGDFNDFDSSFLCTYFNMENRVTLPTRGDSLLDQLWISSPLLSHYASYAEVGPPLSTSDHRTIFLKTKSHSAETSGRVIKFRDYRSSNLANFTERLSNADFTSVTHQSSVDMKCSAFYQILDDAASCIPVNFITLSGRDKPWITPLLKLLINKRWNAYRCKDWPRYDHYKRKVKSEMLKAKGIWANRQLDSCRGMWNIVKELRGGKNVSRNYQPSNHEDMDNLLLTLTANFQANFNDQMDAVIQTINDNGLWEPSISVYDVERELMSLNERKSVGSDSVDAKLLRTGAPWLAPHLHDIFMCSIRTRRFPTRWKLADVIPIPKNSSPSAKDYRPISLLPVVAKLFEKLILKSVKASLLRLYGPQQHAFRPLGSTSSALIKIHDHITKSLDNITVDAVRVVCLDFSKAFDKIHHKRLINYLFESGLSGGFLLWLRDYLTNRHMRVRLNGCLGPEFEVVSGVPQGSVLGPYLFASFMGSLSRAVDANMVIYADDVTLIEELNDGKNASGPDKLPDIELWAKENRFSLNYLKTKQILFVRAKSPNITNYPRIDLVSSLKILGVFWSNDLRWNLHVEHVMKCCSQRLYVIRVLRNFLPRPKLICVYHSLITSIVLYSAPLFSWLPTELERGLEKFQNRAHRIICGSKCECSDFPPLSYVRQRRAAKFLRSCESFPEHPLHDIIPERLPRSGQFRLPVARTSRRLHSFVPWTCAKLNFDYCLTSID